MDPHLPKFIADYPTGKIDGIGQHLRHMSRDSSGHLPPLRPIDTAGLAAIIMPVSRRAAGVRKIITQNMRLCEEFGLYLIVLSSHECSRHDIEQFAREFPRLRWAAVDGPFTFSQTVKLATDTMNLSFPPENDLSAKRNFGLLLGRDMGWEAVLFADDDRLLTRKHLLKMIDLRRNGAALVMSNSRYFPDNSVVVTAYRQAYGNDHIDSFMDSSTAIIELKDWLGFYPHIYNEDWLFMLPHILQRQEIAWAGSVSQGRYNPFIKARAKREEAGDLLAEGLMRLAITLMEEYRGDSKHDLLAELVKRANKAFWEREILQRAIFIREMLNKNQLRTPSLRKRRINSALSTSLQTLIGDGDQNGLEPGQLANWVRAWGRDIKTWRALPAPLLQDTEMRIGSVLRLMDAEERSTYQDTEQSTRTFAQAPTNITATPFTSALSPAEMTQASAQMTQGLESTWHLMNHLDSTKQSIYALVRAVTKLRYDRPIRSLTGNKPVVTVAIVVRMYESPDSVIQSIKNIVAWNTQRAPIHCIVWVTPDTTHRRQLDLYREYLMARLMLETAGTNIRLLSCIGNSKGEDFRELLSELVTTTAMLYWKSAIDSVSHPVLITNSQNEMLSHGLLSELLLGQYHTPQLSLKQHLAMLVSPQANSNIDAPEDHRAAKLARNRLLRQSRTRWQLPTSTWRLMWTMKHSKISLFELDKLHYLTQVHHQLEFDAFAYASHVTGVLLSAGAELDEARSAIEHAIAKAASANISEDNMSGVVLIIKDSQSLEKLEEYRSRIVSEILPDITIPEGVFIATSIIPELKNGSMIQLNTCEALIRYEHWLENHGASPKMRWAMPNPRHRLTITRSLRLSHTAMALIARARAS